MNAAHPPGCAARKELTMNKVMIVGAGGVGNVVAHKCAQVPDVFGEIILASRTKARANAVAAGVRQRTGRQLQVEQVDADNVAETTALLQRHAPKLLINVALPY